MALAKGKKHVKKERQAIYFDLICGAISSILSISGIVFFTIQSEIMNPLFFIIGFVFLILYLIISLFVIFYGLYSYFLEKKGFENRKKKRVLKPPIV